MNNFKIIIAMSGGIDSTLTAYLLKKINFNVKGIFFINFKKNFLKKILNISIFLNIKIIIINYYNFYKTKIFKKVVNSYLKNFNINSDVFCNNKFKFNILIKYCKSLKFKKLSTGHFVKIKKIKKNYKIIISKDFQRNQIYFLYNIKSNIKNVIFPLGVILKKFFYIIIKKFKNLFYKEKESRGVCFTDNKKFKKLINNFQKKKIDYIFNNKNIIGLHSGNFFYVLGQKNINIKYKKFKFFINNKIKNKIFISKNKIFLIKMGLIIKFYKKLKENRFYLFKIKHDKKFFLCKLKKISNFKFLVLFEKLLVNTVIGQSIVLFYKNLCLGGGIIINLLSLTNFY